MTYQDVAAKLQAALYPADYGSVAMGGHCGVLATAIFAGRSFQDAWDALQLQQPEPRGKHRVWQGATSHLQRQQVLDDWEVPHHNTIHLTAKDWKIYGSVNARKGGYLPRCSVATFARKHAKPGVTYMLRVSRHVVTLRDGIVIDQSRAAPAAQHPSGRSIVTTSIERLSE